ncbi:MAG TPA: serine/threonine protein kinase [Nitrospirae bacterium]|nr:serine/threonine protein kinase [Nitrospirota bacterium]
MAGSFDFKKRLGAGNFGEVWLVVDTGLNSRCALKCIPPDKVINQNNFFQEAQLLKIAEHSNIVKVLETGRLNDGRIYVAMEYIKRGSLEDEASGAYVALTRAKKVMIDILRGLEYSHSKNIIHRDIKPANILISSTLEGKLSDFGLALPDISTLNLSLVKQYQYLLHLAPEVNKFSDYSRLSDIYSCGITFYRLVNGDSYLPQVPLHDVRQQTIEGKYPSRNDYRDFIPRAVKLVINKAMNIDPSKRYQSAKEMRHAIEQLNIRMNWHEKKLQNGYRWSCGLNKGCYQVEKIQSNDKTWCIETKKGSSKDKLKRILRLCFQKLQTKDADKKARAILQDFVNGQEK